MKWQNINKKPEERQRLYVVRMNHGIGENDVRDMAYLRKDGTWDTDGVITHYLDETPSPDPDILVKALEEIMGLINSSTRAYTVAETALNQYKSNTHVPLLDEQKNISRDKTVAPGKQTVQPSKRS